ncbi:MAG: cbb3-type cytochrome c oxidase subunit 3 [Alphaproteobacteria bacterium]|nr:cbb3-type cytochrome c oxidase subunit 3 [Alphaproteobacteria bacterium]
MDYDTLATFSRSWGTVYLMLVFFALCAYALWPRNRDKFDRASRMPLDEDDR